MSVSVRGLHSAAPGSLFRSADSVARQPRLTCLRFRLISGLERTLLRNHEVRPPVRGPRRLVVSGIERKLLSVADGADTRRVEPQLQEIPLGGQRAPLAEPEVVLRGAPFVAVSFDGHVPGRKAREQVRIGFHNPPAPLVELGAVQHEEDRFEQQRTIERFERLRGDLFVRRQDRHRRRRWGDGRRGWCRLNDLRRIANRRRRHEGVREHGWRVLRACRLYADHRYEQRHSRNP